MNLMKALQHVEVFNRQTIILAKQFFSSAQKEVATMIYPETLDNGWSKVIVQFLSTYKSKQLKTTKQLELSFRTIMVLPSQPYF